MVITVRENRNGNNNKLKYIFNAMNIYKEIDTLSFYVHKKR